MPDNGKALAESQTAEAANASAVSKEADLKAQAAQMESVVINAMRQVFGPLQVKTEEDQMHILLPKIPLLCLSVEKMATDIKELNRVAKDSSASNEKRLSNIEDNITWGIRAIIGAIIVAGIGLVVKTHV